MKNTRKKLLDICEQFTTCLNHYERANIKEQKLFYATRLNGIGPIVAVLFDVKWTSQDLDTDLKVVNKAVLDYYNANYWRK